MYQNKSHIKCLAKNFGNPSRLSASVTLSQASGDVGGRDGEQTTGAKIQAYWQDDEEEGLHMEDSM